MLSVVPPPVTVRVPAKVNLHLAVAEPGADGYHDLRTVFQALSLTDDVTVAIGDQPGVEVHGQTADGVPADGSNLAWRAVQALGSHCERDTDNIKVIIQKGIPVAGGMAGGSADAAAALLGLATMWQCDIGRDALAELAGSLGADVPFMLHGGTALGTGRGDRLVPVLGRHTFHWVIAVARDGLATPEVYGELDRLRAAGRGGRLGDVEPLLESLASGDPRQLALLLGNDLQSAAISLRPQLRRTLRAGVDAGALAGIVSGSGPSCAFLCVDESAAARIAAELAGSGVCQAVRIASGPVPGARVLGGEETPSPVPPQVYA